MGMAGRGRAGLSHRRVGSGRVGKQGEVRDLFSQLALPSDSYRLCTFLLRCPRVCFFDCISINDMANINQITLKREIQQRCRLSSPPRRRIESLNERNLSQGSSSFVLTAMLCRRRRGGCSSTKRGEV